MPSPVFGSSLDLVLIIILCVLFPNSEDLQYIEELYSTVVRKVSHNIAMIPCTPVKCHKGHIVLGYESC